MADKTNYILLVRSPLTSYIKNSEDVVIWPPQSASGQAMFDFLPIKQFIEQNSFKSLYQYLPKFFQNFYLTSGEFVLENTLKDIIDNTSTITNDIAPIWNFTNRTENLLKNITQNERLKNHNFKYDSFTPNFHEDMLKSPKEGERLISRIKEIAKSNSNIHIVGLDIAGMFIYNTLRQSGVGGLGFVKSVILIGTPVKGSKTLLAYQLGLSQPGIFTSDQMKKLANNVRMAWSLTKPSIDDYQSFDPSGGKVSGDKFVNGWIKPYIDTVDYGNFKSSIDNVRNLNANGKNIDSLNLNYIYGVSTIGTLTGFTVNTLTDNKSSIICRYELEKGDGMFLKDDCYPDNADKNKLHELELDHSELYGDSEQLQNTLINILEKTLN